MSATPTASLERIATRVCWFKPATVTLSDDNDFLCRVMQWATWEDAAQIVQAYGTEKFRDALTHAPAGILDARSWAYWTRRLGLRLPAPARNLPHDTRSLLPA